MTLFVVMISLFFFYHWKAEIQGSFREDLKSIVVATADLLNPSDIKWILQNRSDPSLQSSPLFTKNWNKLHSIKEKLPVDSVYIVAIEPVKIGEPVILDKPISETNKIYDGKNDEYRFRQVYLIDTAKDPHSPPYYDYSESDEQHLYTDPKAFATSIYQAKGTEQLFMSGYAPIMDEHNKVIALVGANLNVDTLHHFVQRAILLMILAALTTLLLVGVAVYLITNKISEPVQKLKEAALSLAAGEYEEKISVQGPREIVELANTYNTMRDCLLEHINRLRDISYSREMLFGEQECALLLQNRMLDGAIERFDDERIAIKHITTPHSVLAHGFKLDLSSDPEQFKLNLSQSSEEGFEGIYSLLESGSKIKSSIKIQLDMKSLHLHAAANEMPMPIFWSIQQMRFQPDSNEAVLQPGDIVILYNQELADGFPTRPLFKEWLAKVLRQFSKDPIELLTAMISSELNFWQKKQLAQRQAHLYLLKLKEKNLSI